MNEENNVSVPDIIHDALSKEYYEPYLHYDVCDGRKGKSESWEENIFCSAEGEVLSSAAWLVTHLLQAPPAETH